MLLSFDLGTALAHPWVHPSRSTPPASTGLPTRSSRCSPAPTGDAVLVGAHVGGGLEFAFGRKIALDLKGRYIGYLNRQDGDPAIPGAVAR